MWSNMLENAVFSLLLQRLENYWTEFHQTVNIDTFWDKDDCVSVWGQRSRSQHDEGPSRWRRTELLAVEL